jgi:hypothetical protein
MFVFGGYFLYSCMASIRDDPYMGGYITNKGKGVPGLIKEKMELGLENIDKCLVRDERKVRFYKEYFLPANRFILLIHDLTKMDLGKLDALANRYLKSLARHAPGRFLPICAFWARYGFEECLIYTRRANPWTLLGH